MASEISKVYSISLTIKISEKLQVLASIENGALMNDLIAGPVQTYFDRKYEKE